MTRLSRISRVRKAAEASKRWKGTSRKSRKGSFYGIFESMFEHGFVRFIFLVIAFLSVVFVIRMYLLSEFKTEQIEAEMIFYNAFYTPDGFSYVDPATGRTYPGIIDMERFYTARMDSAVFFTNNNHIAARFSLEAPSGNVFREAYMNEQYFTLKHPLAKTRQKGEGGALLLTREVNVWTIENAKNISNRYPSVLVAEIVVGR